MQLSCRGLWALYVSGSVRGTRRNNHRALLSGSLGIIPFPPNFPTVDAPVWSWTIRSVRPKHGTGRQREKDPLRVAPEALVTES